MSRTARSLFLLICAVQLLFAVAFFFQWPPAISLWPFAGTTPLVRWSFVVFVVALLYVSARLLLQLPTIPWKLTPELSVLAGCLFLGAAAYFIYGLLRPRWANAAGQLAGFLAYDLVLIVPLLRALPGVAPEFRTGLIVYLVVVVYSGLLAIYYLFINGRTRILGHKKSDF